MLKPTTEVRFCSLLLGFLIRSDFELRVSDFRRRFCSGELEIR
jgi:hypothetical protein